MKLARHLFGYAPVKLAAMLAAFGGIFVYTRLLSAEEYGRYALMFSVLAVVHTLSLTWVEASAYRYTTKAEAEGTLPDHFKTAFSMMKRALLFSAVLLAVLLVATWDYPAYRIFVPLFALLMPLNVIIKIALEAHRASQRVRRYMLTSTTKILLGFLVGTFAAWQLKLGAISPFVGLLSAAICLALVEAPWMLKTARSGQIKPQRQSEWLRYGIPMALALVLDILLSASDRFLIAYFIDEAAVGGYAAGYGVADKTVLMLCSWVAMAGSPILLRAYDQGGIDAVQKPARSFAKLLFLIGIPAAAGLAMVAGPLSTAMVGESLRDQARQIIPWIAWAGLLNGFLIHYVSESYTLARNTRLRAQLMTVPVIANIVLNLALIPSYGVMGAVYATVLTYAGAVLLLGYFGRRLAPLPMPWRDVIFIIIASALMWPAINIMPELGGWAELILKVAAGGATYLCLVYLFNTGGIRELLKTRTLELS